MPDQTSQAPVAGADPRAWREMAAGVEGDDVRVLEGVTRRATGLEKQLAAALRDAAEARPYAALAQRACEDVAAALSPLIDPECTDPSELAVRAASEITELRAAAARGAEGEALRSIVRDAFREGYTQGRYHSPGKSVRCEAERIGLAYVGRVSDSLDALAPRPSGRPAATTPDGMRAPIPTRTPDGELAWVDAMAAPPNAPAAALNPKPCPSCDGAGARR